MAHRPLRYASMPLSLRLIPTLRSARSSWLEARVGYCRLRPAAASHAAGAHAPTHVRTHSTLGLTVIANDQFRPRTHSRTHPQHARTHRHRKRSVVAFSPLHARPPALLPPPSDLAARPATFLFFFRVPTLFLAGRSFLSFRFALRRLLSLSACFRVAPRATPARNQKPAR